MKNKLNIFDIIVFIGISLMLLFGIIYKISIFEIIVGIIGLLAGFLNSKGFKFYLYAYGLQSLLYGIECVISKQYGLAILSLLICLPLYLISIFKDIFNKNKIDNNNNIIKTFNKKYYLNMIIVMSIIGIGYYYLLILLNSKYPLFNTIASLFCIISTFLASRFFLEQWIFWFGYSIMSSLIWLLDFNTYSKSAIIYLIMNVCFIIVNISGSITWISNYKKQNS